MSDTVCPRCGTPVQQAGRGRPAKWCSASCRTAASTEGKLAAVEAERDRYRDLLERMNQERDEWRYAADIRRALAGETPHEQG